RRQVWVLRQESRGDAGDDRRGERRSGAEVWLSTAIVIGRCNRSAEDPLRRRQNLQTAAAGTGPPTIVLGHSAHRDQPVDLRPERGGETNADAPPPPPVDHRFAA